jgi:tRNA(Ile)-lysidine synthase
MLKQLEQKVADFVGSQVLFDPPRKILLAVSGGADSTALLYVMCALRTAGILPGYGGALPATARSFAETSRPDEQAEMMCAHINHQLRGTEADRDEDFVVEKCGKLGLSVTTRRVDVKGFARDKKLSIETAARKLRIESLLDIAKANGCGYIATAHHKDDNAETVIQRLLRGTGFRGLAGIWPVRTFPGGVRFARPLLCVARYEIEQYLKGRDINWCIDSTNLDCIHRRNYIRHQLLPALQAAASQSLVEQLWVLSQSARGFHKIVCASADKVWAEAAECGELQASLDLSRFAAAPQPVQAELVRRGLEYLGSGEGDLKEEHYERIVRLGMGASKADKVQLPRGLVAWADCGRMVFCPASHYSPTPAGGDEQNNLKPVETVQLTIPGRTEFAGYMIDATILDAGRVNINRFSKQKTESVEWFDLDRIRPPVVVRFRIPGDRFQPLGYRADKKVGKFFTGIRAPKEVRDKALIIADSEKIIWVCPIRISEEAKVTGETRQILQLQVVDET